MAQRQKIPAADVLFSSGRSNAERGPTAQKKVKVTVYMPPELVADLDDLRSVIRRQGATVDRSALINECIHKMVHDHADTLVSELTEEN